MKLDPAGGKKLDESLSLAESYELCRRVQKAHSRTYYFSTRLFPAEELAVGVGQVRVG